MTCATCLGPDLATEAYGFGPRRRGARRVRGRPSGPSARTPIQMTIARLKRRRVDAPVTLQGTQGPQVASADLSDRRTRRPAPRSPQGYLELSDTRRPVKRARSALVGHLLLRRTSAPSGSDGFQTPHESP